MGKSESQVNRPANASLSYTLDHLRTFVTVEKSHASSDHWEALTEAPWQTPGELVPFEMTERGKEKFLRHFKFLKTRWQINDCFILRSANNFPADSGIASSASSFAALTLAAAEV